MKRLIEAFDDRGNAPGRWWWFGKNLFVAADVLRQQWTSDPGGLLMQGRTAQARTSIAIYGPMLMLRACALECWFKALYIDAGNKLAVNGHFKKPPGKHHDLVSLAESAKVSLEAEERALLAKLQRYVTAGRYPIEMSWHTPPPTTSGDPMTSWDEADEALLSQLRIRLLRDDERLSSLQGGDA